MNEISMRLDHLIRSLDEMNRKAGTAANPELEALKAAMHTTRTASKAAKIGNGRPFGYEWQPGNEKLGGPTARWLAKALYNGDRSQIGTVGRAMYLMSSRDPDDYRAGKALLEGIGAYRQDLPEKSQAGYYLTEGKANLNSDGGWGKATLGTTGATGGYVLPNNLVDSVRKPATMRALYADWVTVVNGVAVRGVDQPLRTGTPPMATFQPWGQSKENLNEAYGSYTATLGTLARIYDVGKQYLRFSAGSAEQDVMDELTKAMALGENYYIVNGQGGGAATPGVGDPTVGVYTALAASSAFLGYTTAFSAASQSTILGSFAQAVSQAAGALAQRNRTCEMVVVDAATYFEALAQGSDTAGFWVSPRTAPADFRQGSNGGLSFWGIPILWDSNLNANTGTTKIAIAAEWSAFKLYRGMEFRIESSDVAGTRWDQNLVGFRGEEEIGFNANASVNVGAAQLITSAVAT